MKFAKTSSRPGAATTEFALVIPIFFIFILTMVEVGRGLMMINLMQHAARTACRVGVLPGKTTSDVRAAANEALKNQGLKDVRISVQLNGVASAEVGTASSNDRITVAIAAPIASNTWLPGARFVNGAMAAQFTLPRE